MRAGSASCRGDGTRSGGRVDSGSECASGERFALAVGAFDVCFGHRLSQCCSSRRQGRRRALRRTRVFKVDEESELTGVGCERDEEDSLGGDDEGEAVVSCSIRNIKVSLSEEWW